MLPIFSILVVFFPFYRVTEHIVCFIDFLKTQFGIFILRIFIRVIFSSQFPVSGFNFSFRSFFGQTKCFIVIYGIHLFRSACVQFACRKPIFCRFESGRKKECFFLQHTWRHISKVRHSRFASLVPWVFRPGL